MTKGTLSCLNRNVKRFNSVAEKYAKPHNSCKGIITSIMWIPVTISFLIFNTINVLIIRNPRGTISIPATLGWK